MAAVLAKMHVPAVSARLRWPVTTPPTPAPAPPPPTQQRRVAVPGSRPAAPRRLAAVLDRNGGGAGVLDRPGFETIGPGGGPQTDESGARRSSRGGRGLGGGSWRVLLLDSDKHTEQRVVNGITAVVPGADEAHAANCYHTVRRRRLSVRG